MILSKVEVMAHLRIRKIPCQTAQLLNLRYLFTTFSRHKSSKMIMKRVMRENKILFGKLLETKQEKLKKLKSMVHEESYSINRKSEEPSQSTELAWVLNSPYGWVQKIKKPLPVTQTSKTVLKVSAERNGFIPRSVKKYINESSDPSTIGTCTVVSENVKCNNVSALPEVSETEKLSVICEGNAAVNKNEDLRNGQNISTVEGCSLNSSTPKAIIELPNTATEGSNLMHEESTNMAENVEFASKDIKSESVPEEDLVVPLKASESNHTNTSEIPIHKKSIRPLSDIIIKNITSFSIFTKNKNISVPIDTASEVITIPNEKHKSYASLPSVTHILNESLSEESKLRLDTWKKNMILSLGEEGFERYQSDLFMHGRMLHSSIENTLLNKVVEVPEPIQGSFDSIKNILKDVNSVTAVETLVVHPKLQYKGIIDCVAFYRGKLCVIDWKKSERPKLTIHDTYDAPLQIASYIGALNADGNYPFEVSNGLVVVAYNSGAQASVHEINQFTLQMYWKMWLKRLQTYYTEFNQKKE
ncbi:uncharacterized protein LOC105698873 [Orussus abietinus]|uniref:uncharacterized protein LOC105698873 n=1 Tax=Orussus abietinus TaxID=222816 RepID=UPI0006258846|nr:uncharacterized protein LOC105698873 [Orussus abietinus]XP_012278906.1 uncharacterized protein LOC105698873 [Orussus abietinus]XP_012278907.1 uncharacterized protein LOC105698873 [Orussus abietinus]